MNDLIGENKLEPGQCTTSIQNKWRSKFLSILNEWSQLKDLISACSTTISEYSCVTKYARSGSCALDNIWKRLHCQFHKIFTIQPHLSNNTNTPGNKIKTWITLDVKIRKWSNISRYEIIHPQWCKYVDEAWCQPLDNSRGIIYWALIQDIKDRRQTGEKILLNLNTYNWIYIQNNNSQKTLWY